MTKEQELGLTKRKHKFDIREEYFVRRIPKLVGICILIRLQRLSAAQDENWENKRIPRPKGLPEWGVPPPESPPAEPKSSPSA